jgi:hypothetical protein
MMEISNAQVKAKCIDLKKKAPVRQFSPAKAASCNTNPTSLRSLRRQTNSPVKLAWAVQSPRIAPSSIPHNGIQTLGLIGDSSSDASNTFITAVPVAGSAPGAMPSGQNVKEILPVELAKKTERSRHYSILTDMDIPSRVLDIETQTISDCEKGSRKFIARKWQLLKILDEHK